VLSRLTSTEEAVSVSGRILLMENHDEAYWVWRRAGVCDRILVHIDAHEDMWWVPDEDSIDIASFISRAVAAGMVKEVFWVVPDQTWDSKQIRKRVRRRLEEVLKSYPGDGPKTAEEDGRISAVLLGRPLKVCPLANLPRISEPVLLDIDVDYLVISRACNSLAAPPPIPWCWPGDLAERLLKQGLTSDLVTIAYSVEGGFTSLKWKYLGDELALRLGGTGKNSSRLRGMEHLRRGILAAFRGDFAAAADWYRQASESLPDSAAPHFLMARLYVEQGSDDLARKSYRLALAQDPSYQTCYNTEGYQFYRLGRLRDAAREHRQLLVLDPTDASAHFGLGQVAARKKDLAAAEVWLRKSLDLDPELMDAWRLLGKVLTRQRRRPEAIAAYERYLKLALAGRRPLEGPIITQLQGPRLLDPNHFYVHARLARLYDQEGAVDRAINGYRMSIAMGWDGVFPRLRLACLYLKRGQRRQSLQEAWQAVKSIPGDIRNHYRRSYHRARLAFRLNR